MGWTDKHSDGRGAMSTVRQPSTRLPHNNQLFPSSSELWKMSIPRQ